MKIYSQWSKSRVAPTKAAIEWQRKEALATLQRLTIDITHEVSLEELDAEFEQALRSVYVGKL